MADAVVIVPMTIIRKHSNGTMEIYKKREELGRGGFATVYRVTNEATQQSFALKATSRQLLTKPKVMQKHRSEVAIQRSLDHEYILKLYDFFEDSVNTYMVLELCPGRSVRDLVKRKNHLSEPETVKILRNVIEGLCYLHDNRIIHRDLKLENFLIGNDGKVRIADFGLSAKLDYDDEKKYTVCGTPNYLSPELLIPGSHGHRYEVDIWAIGVCAFAMLTGHPPFETRHKSLTYEHIKNCQYHFPVELNLSYQAKSFIKSILQINPDLRPSAYELLQHPFICGNTIIEKPISNPMPPPPPPSTRNQYDLIRKARDENIALNIPSKKVNYNILDRYEQVSMPDSCVSRFCDHSEKYGLGYLLINGTVGACFNDLSRMVIDPFDEFIQYWDTYQDQVPQILRKDDVTQMKKISILQKFAESLRKTKTMYSLPEEHFDRFVPMHHVKYWMRNDDATLFRMDDRNIQLNFNDRTKMVIFWHTKQMMTVNNIKETGSLIPLDDLAKRHGLEDQKRRFVIAKKMVAEMSAS
ncbi:CAMK family protein kinase [Tritrichomonas foetus]|uniref:Serine/threonine-protein kinase PLK n=1 Tax=Tritrichomonas foetus TaxID=1144522 RepID=A0A1J4JTD7_9EUKA|nr:CAMK family protein kinase [Tritrichomonas foetus]|eukprot:OHT01688.1 CAMK family protein kinase [Tritrichomonas foetus]